MPCAKTRGILPIVMKRINWQILLGASLIALSAFIYIIDYLIFKDARNIFFYLFQDIGFIPIQILIVTLIVDGLLSMREKKDKLKKMNMVIGAFFSEVGTDLLRLLSNFNTQFEKMRSELIITNEWNEKGFLNASRQFKNYQYEITSKNGYLEELKTFLLRKRDFLLQLLGNSNLLEHESFTDLLWAVSHLTEELANRNNVLNLSDADYEHISGDIKRAYSLLIYEWLFYMKHLKEDYPYLFSLAMRTNPFNPDASAEVS